MGKQIALSIYKSINTWMNIQSTGGHAFIYTCLTFPGILFLLMTLLDMIGTALNISAVFLITCYSINISGIQLSKEKCLDPRNRSPYWHSSLFSIDKFKTHWTNNFIFRSRLLNSIIFPIIFLAIFTFIINCALHPFGYELVSRLALVIIFSAPWILCNIAFLIILLISSLPKKLKQI